MGSYMKFRPDFSHVLIFEGRTFDYYYYHLLVRKPAFLSHFMETVLTYFRHVVIWWLFLNFRSQKKNGLQEYRESKPPLIMKPPYWNMFIRVYTQVGCLTDVTEGNLVLVQNYLAKELHVTFLVSLPVVICWTKLLSQFVRKASEFEMAANLKPVSSETFKLFSYNR